MEDTKDRRRKGKIRGCKEETRESGRRKGRMRGGKERQEEVRRDRKRKVKIQEVEAIGK